MARLSCLRETRKRQEQSHADRYHRCGQCRRRAGPWLVAPRSRGALWGLIIDATNPLRPGAKGLELSQGFIESGGEAVARLASGASVFKTLNQIGFEAMADTSGFAVKPVMFVAGDDDARKPTVLGLVDELGFEAVDAGSLSVARLLEPFAMLWIHMALNRGIGRGRGFAWVKRTG
jgi:predicted dinucleotide-binding enzyme